MFEKFCCLMVDQCTSRHPIDIVFNLGILLATAVGLSTWSFQLDDQYFANPELAAVVLPSQECEELIAQTSERCEVTLLAYACDQWMRAVRQCTPERSDA